MAGPKYLKFWPICNGGEARASRARGRSVEWKPGCLFQQEYKMKRKANRLTQIKGQLPQILLFWSTWFFVVFLGKKLISPPSGNAAFLYKNLVTFVASVVLAGAFIRFTPTNFYRILIPLLVSCGLALAVS